MPEQSPTQKALDEAMKRLCFNCYHYLPTYWCRANLKPLTSTGEDCPYFDKHKRNVHYGHKVSR